MQRSDNLGSVSCKNSDLEANLEIFNSIDNITKNVVSMDGAKKVLKEKCVNVSGTEAAYTRAVEAAETLKECAVGMIDLERMQEDIEEAEPKGELDTVFNKYEQGFLKFKLKYFIVVAIFRYCRNRTIAIDCLTNFGRAVEPCLVATEIDFERIFISIVTKLLDFICYRDGDMIALFIAENGPKCINDNKDQLIGCFNSTFSKYVPAEADAIPTTLPHLEIGAEQCK